MRFYCPACKKIIIRDGRQKAFKRNRVKSYCEAKGIDVYMRRVKECIKA